MKLSSDESRKKVEISFVALNEGDEQSLKNLFTICIVEKVSEKDCARVISDIYDKLCQFKSITFGDIKIEFDILVSFDHKTMMTNVKLHKVEYSFNKEKKMIFAKIADGSADKKYFPFF